MPARFVRLGIDYGTSTSKLIFRDPLAPGGEKAYPILRDNTFRTPSSIAVTEKNLIFGCSPLIHGAGMQASWLESIKMRVAGEVTGNYRKYCYGPLPELPAGVTAKDLAILTVWFLLSESVNAISGLLKCPVSEIGITATMGIPMSFYEDEKLRAAFLEIARTGRAVYDACGCMSRGQIGYNDAQEIVRKYRLSGNGASIAEDDVRNLIRSEAEAAMCLAVKSPAVNDGPFAEVDIGAGTTHASIFSILPRFNGQRWLKERLAFFGARSEPFGMDAVDAALAQRQGMSHNNCLSLRGTERDVFRRLGKYGFVQTLEHIREAYVLAWRRAVPKLHQPELESYLHHQVFVVGGGSLVPEIAEIFHSHPAGYEHRLRVRQLEKPHDLHRMDDRPIYIDDLPFMVVAYGLTFDSQEVPETFTPNQIGFANRPTSTRVNWEDM
jgi:hypothetical protein